MRSEARPAAVAGLFYPDDSDILRETIRSCFLRGPGAVPPGPPGDALGLVCPHAGYEYSGAVAAHSYYHMSGGTYPYVVVVGPDHRGAGPPVSVPTHKFWGTPLMDSPIRDISWDVARDDAGHAGEHSIEVQVPMIQYTFGDIPVLPVLMADQSPEAAVRLGRLLFDVTNGDRPCIIASSDLTHYMPEHMARERDTALIRHITNMDICGMYDTIRDMRVSACGYGPMAAVMQYCMEAGATRGRLLKYATSGDTSGDMSSVVGYCSVAFS